MNLFICNTPVHILRAVHMQYSMAEFQDAADIFLGSNFHGCEDIAKNLQNTDIFKNVLIVDTRKWKRAKTLQLMYSRSEFSKRINSKKYHKLVCFNIEGELVEAAYNLLKNNEGFEYHCVEDAPGLYSPYEPTNYGRLHINRLLGVEKSYFHMKKWWFSQPDLIEIPGKTYIQKDKLPAICKQDRIFVKNVNEIFGYKPDEQFNNVDILIMEESFYTDGRLSDNSDYDLYKKIKNTFPEKKFLVKLHPRTRENRFVGEFDIMKNTWIPWEVYLLNRIDQTGKAPVQLGIIGTTMSSDKFLFNEEGKKIVLAPLFYNGIIKYKDGTPIVGKNETQNFEKVRNIYINPENFLIAHDEKQIMDYIKMWT